MIIEWFDVDTLVMKHCSFSNLTKAIDMVDFPSKLVLYELMGQMHGLFGRVPGCDEPDCKLQPVFFSPPQAFEPLFSSHRPHELEDRGKRVFPTNKDFDSELPVPRRLSSSDP